MKVNKLLVFVSIGFILLLSLGTISASDNSSNLTFCENNISSLSNNLLNDDNYLTTTSEDIVTSNDSRKTITIEVDEKNPNQVLKPTIQPAIDEANPGDTIILKGNFVHCHFLINKTINIIGTAETSLGPCPHHQTEDAGSFGVFYITEEGNGSVFEGITFLNTARATTPFAFLIRGANDITISNCSINYPESDENKFQAIVIENSNNVKISNLIINNTINGVKIINSSNVEISDCVISNNLNQAISVSGDSNNINIKRNFMQNCGNCGINLTSVDNIVILNNFIENNGLNDDDSGSGIYVNSNITKLTVKGNIFINNGLHAILYDYRCRNLNNENGADLLTDVDNNYFESHSSMLLHHRIYIEHDQGDLKYDAENDVYGSVGEGKYIESKSYVYMKHALIFNDVPCGFTYYTTKIPWTLVASGNNGKYDLSLKLSIKQIKNGVYQVSIVDSDGNVAGDCNSVNIPVFLNHYSTVTPQKGDVYVMVLLKNGVGTADFRNLYGPFKTTGNVITAVFPGMSQNVADSCHVQLNIKDSDFPINPTTKITASKMTTFPLSDKYLSVKLTDSKGKAISGEKVTFKFNGKTYTSKTNSNGIAKVKVSLSTKKTYSVTISYAGSDDYKSSKTTTNIVVKSGSEKSKITASNMKVKNNTKKTFKLKLTDSGNHKTLKNQKVVVKLNGKSITIKTNSKGIAKLSVKLTKVKNYKIVMKFLGNAEYKSASLPKTITVTT